MLAGKHRGYREIWWVTPSFCQLDASSLSFSCNFFILKIGNFPSLNQRSKSPKRTERKPKETTPSRSTKSAIPRRTVEVNLPWTKLHESVNISFVAAKSRVAPIRPLTIPKLELQETISSSRLSSMLQKKLRIPITRILFWTDSTRSTVDSLIEFRFQSFVEIRIGEIMDMSSTNQWRHVLDILNPADDCSHGLQPSELSADHR